jgi:hypothetical protein
VKKQGTVGTLVRFALTSIPSEKERKRERESVKIMDVSRGDAF